MLRRTPLHLLLIPIAIGLLAGCSSNHASGPGFGTMSVRMTDAPGDFEHVYLVVDQVSAHLAGSGDEGTTFVQADTDTVVSEGGWIVLEDTPATYDLLALQNGVFTTIGLGKVPAGRYTQIRLKLGSGSTVVVDGAEHALTVPSGLQTGLKLVGNFDVPANGLLDVALDFDAARSVHQNGRGTYILRPTVKVLPFSTAGGITGLVAPAGTETSVYALQAGDTLGTASAAADGRFTLGVLAPGAYDVAFHPAAGFRDTTLAGVAVAPGATTDVGTVQLTAQ